MPHSITKAKRVQGKPLGSKARKVESRYSVGLVPAVAHQVERYAETVDMSMSKAIASLVRLGLENQESRKREFFRKLKQNLDNDDPAMEDRLVDEFRALILGHYRGGATAADSRSR